MGLTRTLAAIAVPAAALAVLAAPTAASADVDCEPFTKTTSGAQAYGNVCRDMVRGTVRDTVIGDGSNTYSISWYKLVNGSYVLWDNDQITVTDGQTRTFVLYPERNGVRFVADRYVHTLTGA
ncbi:hypothetical protein [Thermomonospora umbrina]|uniref:Beta/gamma crystallin n=1 Tax=Thermomonospora umbrina TaxID=111806 RepID=A0A3D9SQT7_9ACTN|nr:hypothetical protein [Thermomonospora umbrina]REE98336.1 hypothetical protein DFJ69_3823 [Thermomonospora umbrina]